MELRAGSYGNIFGAILVLLVVLPYKIGLTKRCNLCCEVWTKWVTCSTGAGCRSPLDCLSPSGKQLTDTFRKAEFTGFFYVFIFLTDGQDCRIYPNSYPLDKLITTPASSCKKIYCITEALLPGNQHSLSHPNKQRLLPGPKQS